MPSPKNRLRDVARKARGAVAPDDAAGSDAATLLDSGLFDPWYYRLQTGLTSEPIDAAEHFLQDGAAAGLLPNPLTDLDATGLAPRDVIAALLDGTAASFPVRPFFDDSALVELAPAAAEHPGGPVGFYLHHAHAGAPVPLLGPRSWPRFVQQRRQQGATLQAIIDTGLFDHDYYALQTGRTFLSERQAIWHFLETGESAALSPSPLYERGWYRSKANVTMPLTFRHFLRTGQVEGAAGPHFDGATYLAQQPGAAAHVGGPLGHFLAHATATTLTVPAPDSDVEPVEWGTLREALVRSTTGTATQNLPEVAGRVSLLLITHRERHLVRDAIDHALAETPRDIEVIVVDSGSDREVTAILTAIYLSDPRVRVLRGPEQTSPPAALDLAIAAATGELTVVMAPDDRPHPGWLAPLLAALERPEVLAAQPLILSADDTVWSAGIVSHGPHVLPGHLLARHPVEDVPDTAIHPDAVSAVCLAMRTSDLVRLDGFDPALGALADVDLCLRLAGEGGGRFETVTSSRVSRQLRVDAAVPEADQLELLERWGSALPPASAAHWQQAGLVVEGWLPGAGLPESRRRTTAAPVLARPAAIVADGPAAGLPRLRWAIKIAAKGGPIGDVWGDTYFAADLVRGLRALGQEAFVDRRGAHERPGVDHLDDVTLTLRGRWPAVAQPGATNIMWVISHPDEVPADELTQGFDLVYSAGRTWADEMTSQTGLQVRTLLQATDTSRFTPDGAAMGGLGALFVGRTRKVLRPIVRDAVAAGADLAIFGDGWDEFVDSSLVRADHLPNADVPAAYRGARIVLNDHWADMARLGFYSNRLFDAAASGARVVSDPVDGLEEVFGPSVRTYQSVDELQALLAPETTQWPSQETLKANVARIAKEHSFEARAKVLLKDVLEARG